MYLAVLQVLYWFCCFFWAQDILHGFAPWLVLAVLPLQLYRDYRASYYLVERRVVPFNISQMLAPTLLLAFLLIGFNFLNRDLNTYFIAWLGSWLVSTVYVYFTCSTRHIPAADRSWMHFRNKFRMYLKQGVRFAAGEMALNLNERLGIILGGFLIAKDQLGLFAVAVALMQMIWMVPKVFKQVVFSYSVSSVNENEFSLYVWKKVWLMMFLSLGLIVLGTPLVPIMVPLLYGQDFAGVTPLFYMLMAGAWLTILRLLLAGDLQGRGRPDIITKVLAVSCGIQTGLTLILVQPYGVNGIAWATSVSWAAGGLLLAWIYYKMFIGHKNIKG